jgi:excisionase family DNA binding protein
MDDVGKTEKPGEGMETYLTIEELARYLKVAEQTIRRWVLNREVPFCKIKKVIRFRLSQIEAWVDNGGVLTAVAVEKDAAPQNEFNGLLGVTDTATGAETEAGAVQ